MSTSLTDFISCWNETMPMQIRESDIKAPNEMVFRRLLISVLKQLFAETIRFGSMDAESGSRLRTSRVKLVAAVNHFYKIAYPGAKQDFCFMDLIKPNYKKSFSVLNYLHNYCVFGRHTYSSTILDLKEKIQEREELRISCNNLRKELEGAKIKEENNIKAIKEVDMKIPRHKEKLAEAEGKAKNLRNEIARLAEAFEQSEMTLLELKNELDSAKTLAVSDDEAQIIISAKESVDKQLEEQDQMAITYRERLQDNSRAIKEAGEITRRMEAILKAFEGVNTSEIKNQNKQLEELKTEVARLKSSITQTRTQCEQLSQNLEIKRNAVAQLQKRKSDIQQRQSNKEAGYKKELKEKKNLKRKLITQEAALNSTYQRLLDERERSFKVTANVIKQISNSLFEDD